MDLRPLLRSWLVSVALTLALPRSFALSISFSSHAPRPLGTPPCWCPWLAVHPCASSISTHYGSCLSLQLLQLADVPTAPVPVAWICASLQIQDHFGLQPLSHPDVSHSAQPPNLTHLVDPSVLPPALDLTSHVWRCPMPPSVAGVALLPVLVTASTYARLPLL